MHVQLPAKHLSILSGEIPRVHHLFLHKSQVVLLQQPNPPRSPSKICPVVLMKKVFKANHLCFTKFYYQIVGKKYSYSIRCYSIILIISLWYTHYITVSQLICHHHFSIPVLKNKNHFLLYGPTNSYKWSGIIPITKVIYQYKHIYSCFGP